MMTPIGLRPKDAAAALGISERKLWEITADTTSGIPVVRLGRSVVYPYAALEAWLTKHIQGNGAALSRTKQELAK